MGERNKIARAFAVMSVMALAVAACGDDDDDDAGGTSSEPAATEATSADTDGTEPSAATSAPATSAGSTAETTAETSGGSGAAMADRDAAIEEAIVTVANDALFGAEGSGLTRGITDDTVTVGCIFEAANYTGFEDGIRARFESGDVNGRTLDLLPCEDDAGDPAQHLNIARRLVEQEKVFAIITASQGVSPAVATYLNESEVPYLGWGFIDSFCAKRWGFGFDGCLNGLFSSPDDVPHAYVNPYLVQPMIEESGLDPSDVRAAIIGSDNDAGRGGNANYSTLFENAGATVVYAEAVVPVPGPTTDYTPFVQAALENDPNIVLISTQFSDVGGLTAALKAAGYQGAIMNFVAYVPGLLESLPQLAEALDGTYVLASLVPQESQNGYIEIVENALAESGAETGTFITFGGSLGFLMADQLSAMVAAAGEQLDTRTFDEALNGDEFVYTSPGEGGPCSLPFPGAHFFSASGSSLVLVEDGQFEVAVPYTCYPPVPVER